MSGVRLSLGHLSSSLHVLQLKSFDSSLSDSTISTQAGFLQGAFTAAQFATAVPWGHAADAKLGERKFVLLLGTSVSYLGIAFSTSFTQAMFWRSFGGAINGMVGIIRTMIVENIRKKNYQSRAFSILPIGFNIASLSGPVLGTVHGIIGQSVSSAFRTVGPVFAWSWYGLGLEIGSYGGIGIVASGGCLMSWMHSGILGL
ncbi:hypothetical protein RJ035_001400 [Blastomyces gilchristii]